MLRDKIWKFKSSSDVSTLTRRVPALRLSPNLAECSLKPRRSSGLLGARLLPVALDSNAGKTRSNPLPAEEVAHVLQSRNIETRPAVRSARPRGDRHVGGSIRPQAFCSAPA